MRKWLALPLTLALMLPAYATDATDWIMGSGVSNGVAAGEYGPQYQATWGQVGVFCNRSFGGRLYREDDTDPISIEDACGLILYRTGAAKWPSHYFPDPDATETARMIGIIGDVDTNQTATRGDVAEILYKIKMGLYSIPETRYTLDVEEGYLNHPLGVMPYIITMGHMPEAVKEAYHGTLTIGDDDAEYYGKLYGTAVAGLFFSATDRIAVTAPRYIAHEMGHFWDYHRGCPPIWGLYGREAEALARETGRRYCTTSRYEFYAEAFDLYARAPERLRSACPETFREIEDSLR